MPMPMPYALCPYLSPSMATATNFESCAKMFRLVVRHPFASDWRGFRFVLCGIAMMYQLSYFLISNPCCKLSLVRSSISTPFPRPLRFPRTWQPVHQHAQFSFPCYFVLYCTNTSLGLCSFTTHLRTCTLGVLLVLHTLVASHARRERLPRSSLVRVHG